MSTSVPDRADTGHARPALDAETQVEIKQAVPCGYGRKGKNCRESAVWLVTWICHCGTGTKQIAVCTKHMADMVAGEASCDAKNHDAVVVGDPERI